MFSASEAESKSSKSSGNGVAFWGRAVTDLEIEEGHSTPVKSFSAWEIRVFIEEVLDEGGKVAVGEV